MDDQAQSSEARAESLVSVRAAIDVVAGGGATRITVKTMTAEQILPAARATANAAGVALEPNWCVDDAGCDIVISAGHSSHAADESSCISLGGERGATARPPVLRLL